MVVVGVNRLHLFVVVRNVVVGAKVDVRLRKVVAKHLEVDLVVIVESFDEALRQLREELDRVVDGGVANVDLGRGIQDFLKFRTDCEAELQYLLSSSSELEMANHFFEVLSSIRRLYLLLRNPLWLST